MSRDRSSVSSGRDHAPHSSLRHAFLWTAVLPAAMGCLVVATFLFLPYAGVVAAVAVLCLWLNALAMPLVFDRRVSARLTALADTLRSARDGCFERVPYVDDRDAIGDIARLANDIVATQADIGRYATSLRNAEDFVRISDQMMNRFAGGAQGIERMLEGLQLTASHVSHSSERVVASMDSAASETERTLRDFVSTASRAVRSADAMVTSAGKAAAASAQMRSFELREDRPAQPDLDAVMLKLDDLGEAITCLPGASELRELSEAATAPLVLRMSELQDRTHAALSSLEAPVVALRQAIEAKLDRLEDQIATSHQTGNSSPQMLHVEITALTDAVARIENSFAKFSPVTAAPDIGPIVACIERLERPLTLLTGRVLTSAQVHDLEPMVAALTDIGTRLAAIDMRISAVPATSHPDAGLVAEFDAARAPLQRLLVAFRLAVRDIGQESERLRARVDGISSPVEASSPTIDLSPIAAQLDGIVDRLGSLEAATQEPFSNRTASADLEPVVAALTDIGTRLAAMDARISAVPATSHPDAGLVAEFDAARAPLQRLLVAFRLAVRDIGQESERLRATVDGISSPVEASSPTIDLSSIAAQLDGIADRLGSLEAITPDSARSRIAPADLGQLADFDAGKAPLQRILVGLRLALRDISEGSTEFRETIKQLGSIPPHDTRAVDLSPIAERLDDLSRRFSSIEAATQDAVRTPSVPTADETQILPQLVLDRTAMSSALTGLKLMMREMVNDATALRAAAESLPGKVEIISPPVDLTAITGSLDALHDELAAGHGVLAEIYAQIGRETPTVKESPPGWTDAKTPSLAATLSLMGAFSSAVETQFNEIEGRITDVAQRYLSGDGHAAADDLVTRLLDAASQMRSEVSKFLAIGAALSQQIETANGGRKTLPLDSTGTRSAMRPR